MNEGTVVDGVPLRVVELSLAGRLPAHRASGFGGVPD
jgi:hypothetical protein